jgi:hypothetical protein
MTAAVNQTGWTRIAPKEPGLYFYRLTTKYPVEVVCVDEDGTWFHGDSDVESTILLPGHWWPVPVAIPSASIPQEVTEDVD